MNLRPLPETVQLLCCQAHAPPRLVAHLSLVHDVAVQLIDWVHLTFPDCAIDSEAVSFGAAIHDIGKALVPDELTQPGHKHEVSGQRWLEQMGVEPRLARFAATHAEWPNDPEITLDDLLVALADTCWKGKRDVELEEQVMERISAVTGQEQWMVYCQLDQIIQQMTINADHRLAWQAAFSVTVEISETS